MGGCYYDNKEELYPYSNVECDTSDVTYSNTIVTIINGHCLSCHSNANAASLGGYIPLEDYENVKITIEEGSFLGSILYQAEYDPMPVDYQLSDCEIKQIQAWINSGALND